MLVVIVRSLLSVDRCSLRVVCCVLFVVCGLLFGVCCLLWVDVVCYSMCDAWWLACCLVLGVV